jgi:hypothetical protein
MSFWVDLWVIFFFASLVLFSVLAVVITIGGFFDIRALFKSLSSRPGHHETPELQHKED